MRKEHPLHRYVFTLLTFCAVCIGSTSCPSDAQVFGPGIVHDPLNAAILVQQKLNQATQIQQQVDQINNQLRNLRSYSFNWSNIATELRTLRATLSSPNAKVNNATLQIQQMNGELATLSQIQASTNNAQGQLQATQTQTALVAQLVGQLQKQRQLNLAAIMQDNAELQQFKAMGYQSSSVRGRL
jgi:chromosome segregation ATPase